MYDFYIIFFKIIPIKPSGFDLIKFIHEKFYRYIEFVEFTD